MFKKFTFKPIYYGYIGYFVTVIVLLLSQFWYVFAFIAAGLLLLTSGFCCFVVFRNYSIEKHDIDNTIATIAYKKTLENGGVNAGDETPISREMYKEVKKYRRKVLSPLWVHLFVFLTILSMVFYQLIYGAGV